MSVELDRIPQIISLLQQGQLTKDEAALIATTAWDVCTGTKSVVPRELYVECGNLTIRVKEPKEQAFLLGQDMEVLLDGRPISWNMNSLVFGLLKDEPVRVQLMLVPEGKSCESSE